MYGVMAIAEKGRQIRECVLNNQLHIYSEQKVFSEIINRKAIKVPASAFSEGPEKVFSLPKLPKLACGLRGRSRSTGHAPQNIVYEVVSLVAF